MTNEEFLKFFKRSLNKKTVEKLAQVASSSPDSVKCLLDLSFHPQPQVAFRAAWVLEHCLAYSHESMVPNLPSFLDAYSTQDNNSCRRHFTKILMFFSEKRQIKLLSPYELTPVVKATFEWLINPETPVAVQVNCMDILFNLRHKCDWVEEELRSQVIFLLKDGTAAMQSRGKRLLKN